MWQRMRRHRQRQQHRSKKWTRADGRWSVWTQAARASVKTTARLTYPPLLAHNTHTKQVRDTDRGRQKKVMQSVLDQLKPAAQFSLNKSFYSKDITWNQMFLKANRKKLTETRCLSGSNVPFFVRFMTEESLLSCVIARCCCFTFQVNTWGFFQSAYFLFSL